MGTKKESKKKKLKKSQKLSVKQAEEPEKPFDFGGIPPRDLKKNLGCG